jgi:hypothetical protein
MSGADNQQPTSDQQQTLDNPAQGSSDCSTDERGTLPSRAGSAWIKLEIAVVIALVLLAATMALL